MTGSDQQSCQRGPHLHVYAERSLWRWAYHELALDGGEDLRLESAIAFVDAEEARSAATSAYPGVVLADAQQEGGDGLLAEAGTRAKHRCRRMLPAALAVIVLAATAVILLRRSRSGPGPDDRTG